MVFGLLSNVRLHGMDIRPQASASLRLYWQSVFKNMCKALFESSLNHILTTKHLRITVGEYTYGLPRRCLFVLLGHCMQPIRYRMLKRMDSLNLSRANLWDSFSQNHIPGVSFKLLWNISRDSLNYDHASNILKVIGSTIFNCLTLHFFPIITWGALNI